MKRMIFSFLSFLILVTSVQASTGTELKQVYDELTYSLNVEWDQKDQNFYQQKMAKFEAQVKALQAKGMTNRDLIQLVAAETKNEQLKADLNVILTKVQLNLMNESEAQKVMSDLINKSYAKGASWNGDVLIYGAIGLLVVVFVVAYIQCLNDPNHTTVCNDYYSCNTYSNYDYYGSSCGYQTSCGCAH